MIRKTLIAAATLATLATGAFAQDKLRIGVEGAYPPFSFKQADGNEPKLDADGRLRADLAELEPKVQDAVAALWNQVTDDNVNEISDFAGYKAEFLRLFGFEIDGVDYDADVNPTVKIEGLVQA